MAKNSEVSEIESQEMGQTVQSLPARAWVCACEAHKGQVDKGGAPYILHPLFVAREFEQEGDQDAYVVGLLHDVLEDSSFTAEDLLRDPWFISAHLVQSVVVLTHKNDGLSYMEYIAQVKQDPLARKVKIADLRHNLDASRLPEPLDDTDRRRLEKYRKALELLTKKE